MSFCQVEQEASRGLTQQKTNAGISSGLPGFALSSIAQEFGAASAAVGAGGAMQSIQLEVDRPSAASAVLALAHGEVDEKEAIALLKQRADVHACAGDLQRSMLHFAAEKCYVKLLEELLKRRADPNHADRAGETSLFALAHSISWCDQAPRHRRATVQRLVEGAADVNFANPRGKTPLHVAAGHTDAAALEALLAERADVDARDLGGFTALMWAAGRGHGGNVQRLLDARARSDLSANRGQTAMLFALTNHCEEVVKTLEEHAALQDRKAGRVLPEWAHRRQAWHRARRRA
ncbi:unnamed protein product [Durusdinium trenchii]|uniref:Uncharacterized protein n=1 Tax=Durusdinium trenchii TaxID=1381693 RepID=A0ABP0JTA8_9DINO